MKTVRLTQLDGKLPNLALMRLSSWHKAQGDVVHFQRGALRLLDEPKYDIVYGSAIFKFSAEKIERFKREFPDAIIGGTGSGNLQTVEEVIGDWPDLDYSHWPDFTASLGFTQRGCRLSCKFCVVPTKEGKPRHESTVVNIWRGDGHPKNIHLLDNDFFGGPDWQRRIDEIREGGFRVCFSQGINVRAVTPEVAQALASIQYRDNSFTSRRLYTAWDNLKDEAVFFKGVDILDAHGIPPTHLMAYMLVGFDKNETWERIHRRFGLMVERGIRPYPMVFDLTRKDLKRFQRWAVTGLYRAVRWEDYDPSAKKRMFRSEAQPDMFEVLA